jgi:hypothetical protein
MYQFNPDQKQLLLYEISDCRHIVLCVITNVGEDQNLIHIHNHTTTTHHYDHNGVEDLLSYGM